MIPYREKLNVKQFIKHKPTKLVVKVFALCGSNGILHDIILYEGKSTEFNKEYLEFRQGTAAVMQLTERMNAPNSEIYYLLSLQIV